MAAARAPEVHPRLAHRRRQEPKSRTAGVTQRIAAGHFASPALYPKSSSVEQDNHRANGSIEERELRRLSLEDVGHGYGHASNAEHLHKDQAPVCQVVNVKTIGVDREGGPGQPKQPEHSCKTKNPADSQILAESIAQLDKSRDVDEIVEELKPPDFLFLAVPWAVDARRVVPATVQARNLAQSNPSLQACVASSTVKSAGFLGSGRKAGVELLHL